MVSAMRDEEAGMACPTNDLVAAELRAIIARKKLDRGKAAKAMGLTRTYLSKRLDGALPITLDDVDRAAAAFGGTAVAIVGAAVATGTADDDRPG
jgi:transcriptional regulator with XRE-family HTH domain